MFKEILTDKNFIGNVIHRFILWMISIAVFIFFSIIVLSYSNGKSFFDTLSFLSIERIIKVALTIILLITVSEMLREYRKRYTL